MDVLWCYRMDDGGGHCDIDQMLASQLAAPTLYFHSGLGQLYRTSYIILQQQQKSLFRCIAAEPKKETETLRPLIFLTGLANWSIFSLV